MIVDLTLTQHALSIVSGAAVGFTLGLIGGGGSVLAVPLLLYLVGYPIPHVVIGTTALAVSVNAYLNLIPHARAGNVRWKEAVIFAIVGAVAAFIGSSLGKVVDGKKLLFLFAIVMLVIAALMARPRRESPGVMEGHPGQFSMWKLVLAAAVVGTLSGFFGIGGGFLIVPGLVFATGMPMLAAIGTSLFSVGTFGLTTAMNYASSGLLDWAVAGLFIAGGVAGGVIGARMATHLGKNSKGMLNMIFAALVAAVAVYMIYRNLSAFGIHL
ncbi:sulfite exporter TauE/SafE [mine drainage metagenome]|uniref:Sulfite exporter TauE/SafE n=1 Tax=mine drainage metagenome TaxID=410659 RepID=A0A1J5PT06_9ZZZZ